MEEFKCHKNKFVQIDVGAIFVGTVMACLIENCGTSELAHQSTVYMHTQNHGIIKNYQGK